MSAIETFCFSGYILRPANADDLSLATYWTEKDADHAGRVAPSFWTEQRLGSDSYLLSDVMGPIFFFKMVMSGTKAVEVHIQFMAARSEGDRMRLCDALTEGMRWLERMLRVAQIDEIFFDSRARRLIRFSQKRLGFTLNGERLSKRISSAAVLEKC